MSAKAVPARYHTLDGVRGFAALLVAAYHFTERLGPFEFPGYLAVDLFFVLSGFVIALNYQERLASGLSAFAFMRLRVVRLYPLYLLGWAMGLAKQISRTTGHAEASLAPVMLAQAALLNGLVLPMFGTSELFPINSPGWSLFFEFAVNFVFALVLFRLSNRALVAVMVAALAALAWLVAPPTLFNLGWSGPTFAGGVARTVFSFCTGILIFRVSPAMRRHPATWLCLLPIAATLVVIGAPSAIPGAIWREWITILLVIPAIVIAGVRWEAPPPLRAMFGWLGALSFPVYIIHLPLIFTGRILMERADFPPLLGLLAYLAVVVAVAWPVALLDQRVARALRPLAAPRRQSAAAARLS